MPRSAHALLLSLAFTTFFAAPVACAADASGASATTRHADDTFATPTLIAPTTALSRGTPQNLAISFTIQEHWHLYFDGQNDTGQPPKLKLNLPPGVTITPLQFPPPKRLVQSDSVLDHIYETSLVLPFQLKISEEFKGDSLTLSGSLDWLECADVCRFGKGNVSLTLPVVSAGTELAPSQQAGTISKALGALPQAKLPEGAKVELTPAAAPTKAVIRVPGASKLTFMPDNQSVGIDGLIASGESDSDTLTLTLSEDRSKQQLSGVLEVRTGSESRWYMVAKAWGKAANPEGPKSVIPASTPTSTPAAPAAR